MVFPSFFVPFIIAGNTLHHHHQVLPTGPEGLGGLVKNGQFETARLQLHVVDHKAATFHVKDFHAGTGTVDKYVHVPVLDVAAHQVGHHSTEGIKTPAHVRWIRIQIILHRRCEAEHPTGAPRSIVAATAPGRSNHPVLNRHRWGR